MVRCRIGTCVLISRRFGLDDITLEISLEIKSRSLIKSHIDGLDILSSKWIRVLISVGSYINSFSLTLIHKDIKTK